MNTSDEKQLEATFLMICNSHEQAAAPDLWPGVEAAIAGGRRAQSGVYRQLGLAGAFAAIAVMVLLFAAPGFTQNALERIRQLLRGNFSLVMGGVELSGVLISEDGEEKELAVDGNVVRIKMTSMDKDSVLVALSVYRKLENGELKLMLRPKIMALKGKPAEIKVTGPDGKVLYKFAITPDKDHATYRGNIVKAQ